MYYIYFYLIILRTYCLKYAKTRDISYNKVITRNAYNYNIILYKYININIISYYYNTIIYYAHYYDNSMQVWLHFYSLYYDV